MKQRHILWLLVLLLLLGCAVPEAREHPDWDEEWFRFGDQLAAETPDGFELNESNDVLSIAGLYYATWTAGKGEAITNAQGRDAVLYDAQIYVLLKECESAEAAAAEVAEWIKRESAAYETRESTVTAAGHAFTMLELTKAQADNPYQGGAAAFGVIGSNAVSVELLCREAWHGDPAAALTAFLNGLHD